MPTSGYAMPGNAIASLEISDLSVRYGKVPALHGASIRICKGQVVTIIGANGAGKSTLMKAIMGLVKPVSGRVVLLGEEITGLEPDRIVPRGIALVPEGRRLFTPMTVQENLEMGAYRRSDPNAVARDMERVLQYFPDLKVKLPLPAGSLSGGQQQMVAVARALMSAPKVMMFDEPTIGLAPAVVDVIANVIGEIRDSGVDVLLVEQNAEMALEIADFGYVMEQGRVVLAAPAGDLAVDPKVQRAYLGI